MTMIWVSLAIGAVQVCLLGWGLFSVCRVHRTLRHAAELDALLAHLCAQCFLRQHIPVWQAWTMAMGDIDIEVSQTRRMPGDRE